jgi:hypothetical protein
MLPALPGTQYLKNLIDAVIFGREIAAARDAQMVIFINGIIFFGAAWGIRFSSPHACGCFRAPGATMAEAGASFPIHMRKVIFLTLSRPDPSKRHGEASGKAGLAPAPPPKTENYASAGRAGKEDHEGSAGIRDYGVRARRATGARHDWPAL